MADENPGSSGGTSDDPPPQINVDVPVDIPVVPLAGIYIPTAIGVGTDNVYTGQLSSDFRPRSGDPSVSTQVDVDNLDKAIARLNQWADYLKRLEQAGMNDIKTLMDGPQMDGSVMQNAGISGEGGGPVGGFPGATQLAKRHSSFWQSYQQGLKSVAANLYDAADALKKVKQKYGDVEHANAMTAAEMTTDFTDAASVPHNL